MRNRKLQSVLVLLVLAAPLLAGCGASLQARSVDLPKDAFLVNPKVLEKGGPGQALYRYQNPAVDFKKYSKVIIDPVVIYKETHMDAETRENYQKLANNGYAYLVQELGKDWTIVQNPAPDTMRVQVAIVQAEGSAVVRNVLTTVVPIGMAISTVKYGVTGKPSAVGEITGEMRVTDAMSGELLGEAVDRRVGGKTLTGMFDSWYNADEAMKHWAKQARYSLCVVHKGSNAACESIKP
jgi:hypothetical protein